MSETGCCGAGSTPGIKPKLKTIRIEAKADDKYKVAVQAGERTLYVDQPLVAGGEGAGASPIDVSVCFPGRLHCALREGSSLPRRTSI